VFYVFVFSQEVRMIINGSFSISSHQICIVLHIATTQFEGKAQVLDPFAGWEMCLTFLHFHLLSCPVNLHLASLHQASQPTTPTSHAPHRPYTINIDVTIICNCLAFNLQLQQALESYAIYCSSCLDRL